MNVPRFLVFLLGLGLVLAAVWVFFFETGLGEVVPFAALIAVTLILLGIGLFAAADKLHADHRHRVVERRWP